MYELIHSEVPMFIIHPFLEQEIMNARYALERGFARVVWEQDADFVQELEALLADSGRLEDMKESMHRAKEEMIDTPLREAAAEMFRKARRYRTSSGYSVLDCFVPLGPADGSKAASI